MPGQPGPCLGGTKIKTVLSHSHAQWLNTALLTHCPLPQRQRVCREKTVVQHVISALTCGTPAGAQRLSPDCKRLLRE